ncbi:fungal-specific transcription factor domain-containing protein [Peziza echinospora]|nr:fungal-specific transcription factor domain-containing protein [Peziza echinospora]
MDPLHYSSSLHPQAFTAAPCPDAGEGSGKAGGEQSKGKAATKDNGAAPGDGRTKPKQSKSRNGCVTCKGKRLKCDETKPTCQQCAKRGVECGGYKKDFKWRAYEETQLTSKAPKQPRKVATGGVTKAKKVPPPLLNAALNASDASLSALGAAFSPFSPTFNSPLPYDAGHQYPYEQYQTHGAPLSAKSEAFDLDSDHRSYMLSQDGSLSPPPHPYRFGHHSHASQSSIDTYLDPNDGLYASANPSYNDLSSSLTGVIPVSEADQHSVYPTISVGSELYERGSPTIKEEELEDDQLYSLAPTQYSSNWDIGFPSPAMSNHSSSSSESHTTSNVMNRPMPISPSDPAMLLLNFDRLTCGIMSVKNGPNENPWRTLVWPLALETPALYHAISAMTAFHMSRESALYRVQGVEHVRKSLSALNSGIGNGSLSDEAALATTLVLAFSEAFDRHITTGTEHLKGAKIMINRALETYQHGQNNWGDRLKRLKFLHNVWVYLDVLARLTSDNDDDDIPDPAVFGPASLTEDVDPLMGCASSLFPLIGRVANLVRRVRRCISNSISIIAEAIELKSLIENWVPARSFLPMEDSATEMVHCLKTAEAYQYATLLYLLQAVPEVCSVSPRQLAKRVLSLLESIPITSGACIVHIYPLLVAGCEADTPAEREWVDQRWSQMTSRMWIGNVDSAWHVVKEVWTRRDMQKANDEAQRISAASLRPPYSNPGSRSSSLPRSLSAQDNMRRSYLSFTPEAEEPMPPFLAKQNFTRSSSEGPIEEFGHDDHFINVRSKLHWVGVMKDLGWEGMFVCN